MNKNNKTRRSTVISIGTGIAGIAGISSGVLGKREDKKEKEDKIIEQSYHILSKTGERSKRIQFLEQHGLETNYEEFTPTIAKTFKQDGEVGIQQIYRSNIDIGFSLTKGWFQDYYTVGMDWKYTDLFEDGQFPFDYYLEDPDDIVGLYWDDNWWDYHYGSPSQNFSTSEDVSYRSGSFGGGARI